MPSRFSSTTASSYADWTDEELVAAMSRDEEEAFKALYDRHWQVYFRLAYRKLGRREDAEEVVQDLFASLWEKRHRSQIGKLEPYLKQAVKFKVIDIIRAGATVRQYLMASQDSLVDLDSTTEDSLAALDLSEALMALVEKLPTPTQEVFRLSRLSHKTTAEIAETLGMSTKMVEYHMTKALKALRAGLKEFLTLAMFYLASR